MNIIKLAVCFLVGVSIPNIIILPYLFKTWEKNAQTEREIADINKQIEKVKRERAEFDAMVKERDEAENQSMFGPLNKLGQIEMSVPDQIAAIRRNKETLEKTKEFFKRTTDREEEEEREEIEREMKQ